MKTTLPAKDLTIRLFTAIFLFLSVNSFAQAPELVFSNPVLKSGTANREGAVYRFSNVTTGVDAEVKLKKFSRPDISMADVDLASLGWDKAFQPQFGLPGNVAPGQNWYIDFEIGFFKSGTTKKQTLSRFDLTSLDVDGDGVSIAEYVSMEQPDSVAYSSVSYLTHGGAGTQNFVCPVDGLTSPVIVCPFCLLGLDLFGDDCAFCDGSGKLFQLCQHPYVNGLDIHGPVTNFYNIDTAATQVMATYTYLDRDRIKFRIGATSGSSSSTAGVRLNSLWFRSFKLSSPSTVLPVKLTRFSAKYNNGPVNLQWESASELTFGYYEVERSVDGKNFSPVAQLKGKKLEGDMSVYNYADNNLPASATVIYYRLKMVDIDGKLDYSPTRSVNIGGNTASLKLITYPNPVVNELKITVPELMLGKNLKIELFNNNGQVIKVQNTVSANQVEVVSAKELTKGFYTMRITSGTLTAQSKLVKI